MHKSIVCIYGHKHIYYTHTYVVMMNGCMYTCVDILVDINKSEYV